MQTQTRGEVPLGTAHMHYACAASIEASILMQMGVWGTRFIVDQGHFLAHLLHVQKLRHASRHQVCRSTSVALHKYQGHAVNAESDHAGRSAGAADSYSTVTRTRKCPGQGSSGYPTPETALQWCEPRPANLFFFLNLPRGTLRRRHMSHACMRYLPAGGCRMAEVWGPG